MPPEPTMLAAFLEALHAGGPTALALVLLYACLEFRKELRQAHKNYQDEIKQIQKDRLQDIKEDRTLYQSVLERVLEELTRGRVALESLHVEEPVDEEDEGEPDDA